jgi:sirohydrochlorin ferrochelatase
MSEFVELRRRRSQLAHAQACFLSMAEPNLAHALAQVARSGARRIVVQPHSLFGGVLLDRIRAAVGRFAELYPGAQWVVTEHLGPSECVAHALLDRAGVTAA